MCTFPICRAIFQNASERFQDSSAKTERKPSVIFLFLFPADGLCSKCDCMFNLFISIYSEIEINDAVEAIRFNYDHLMHVCVCVCVGRTIHLFCECLNRLQACLLRWKCFRSCEFCRKPKFRYDPEKTEQIHPLTKCVEGHDVNV